MNRWFYIGMLFCLLAGCTTRVHVAEVRLDKAPRIYPDYTDLTLPCNIAPLNFLVQEPGTGYQVELGTNDSVSVVVSSSDSILCIPQKKWHQLLERAKGQEIFVRITVEQDGKWVRFADLRHRVSSNPIDAVLAYRLLYPGYEFWNEMGIYQRDLTSFEETCILENRTTGGQCMNCHSFADRDPAVLMLHVRGKHGGTLVMKNGELRKVNPKPEGHQRSATYPSWSNDGRFIVFSSNEVNQTFHTAGTQMIEVYDKSSDLIVYDVERDMTFTDSLVYGSKYMETFPTFTPDGKHIYFCRSTPFQEDLPLDSLRYALYKVDFDAESHTFGNLTCVVDAPAEHCSVSFPRISPDGRWLMYTQISYGTFSIWHEEAELWLLDLHTGNRRCMSEVNSSRTESYHSWSSDGKWFVFSSKRMDGLWARPYIASFDSNNGTAGKPFVLPQKHPLHYDDFTYTYNVPELVKGKVTGERKLEQAIQ